MAQSKATGVDRIRAIGDRYLDPDRNSTPCHLLDISELDDSLFSCLKAQNNLLDASKINRNQKGDATHRDHDDSDSEEDQREDLIQESDNEDDSNGVEADGNFGAVQAQEEDVFGDDIMKAYLESLYNVTLAKHYVPSDPIEIPGLKPHVTPFPHQWRAVAVALQAGKTDFRGLILADPPGLGKTLSALMTVAKAAAAGRGPSCIIAPASCCRQWMSEIEKNFDCMPAVLLTAAQHVSPVEVLTNYKVVVASYHYVAAEFRRIKRYLRGLDDFKSGKSDTLPQRPSVTLLSGIVQQYGVPKWGEYLVLDEAHHVKNHRGLLYRAVMRLRENFNVCLMMTGTPLDNTWVDVWALLSMLHGHPVTSMRRMRYAFSGGAKKVPTGRFLIRLVAFLEAVTLRRPASLIQDSLPQRKMEVKEFDLADEELRQSNAAFFMYEEAQKLQSEDSWAYLTRAQQHVYHPLLADIIELEKEALKKDLQNEDEPELTDDAQKLLGQWHTKLREADRWRSGRVDTIIDIVKRLREEQPDDAVLIMDESVYFLDIVQIALEVTNEDISCFRFDGRSNSSDRHAILAEFREAIGFRVMLATRATGGVGLNLQCANVLIRCGPWWKASWEDQAEARIFRHGQLKDVLIFELKAKGNCRLEAAKRKARDKENRTNQIITKAITKSDDVKEEPRRYHF